MSSLLAALAAALALSSTPGEAHLLEGARRFREERWEEALVEFRVAARLGEPGAGAYAGAALVKLRRWDEAIEAFGPEDPARDALLDYYRALACHGAGLYACADAILSTIGERAGPRLASQAAQIRAALAPALSAPPAASVLEALSERCDTFRQREREALARAYCREVEARRSRAASKDPERPPASSEASR